MRCAAILALAGLVTAAANAAPVHVLGTAGASWQNGNVPQETGARFWDGNSWDSDSTFDGATYNPCNAGSLVGGIACSLNAAGSASAASAGLGESTFVLAGGGSSQYWGHSNGSADLNFVFDVPQGGASYDFSLLTKFSIDWAIGEVGWYELGNPLNRHAIFAAGLQIGATKQVYVPSAFGLYYLNTSGSGELFLTQAMFNTVGNKQQFVAFKVGDTNFVGIEDVFSNQISQSPTPTTADYDYNDVMISFQHVAAIPEASSLLLMGVGLGVVVASVRRRQA